MDRGNFRLLVEATRNKHPFWFALKRDTPATSDEISKAEAALGVSFPREYREFLEDYGGGDFAFANIFSVNAESRWNVVSRNRDALFADGGFLAISDNHVGDYYGYEVVDGKCRSPVVFWDHEEEGRVSPTPFGDLYEYLAEVALRPA